MEQGGKGVDETENDLMFLYASSDESDAELSDSDASIIEHSDDDELDASEDENILEDFKEIDWTDDVKNELLTPEKDAVFNTGPAHDLPIGSTPLQFLKLFFHDDVCEVVQANINRYADLEQKRKNRKDRKWKPIENIEELWRFFCVLLICGIVQLPKLKDYWSSSDILGNQAVKKLMNRTRFIKILCYFHLASGSLSFKQIVEPIMDDIRERFVNHFKPPRELLMDEASFKNKASLRILQQKQRGGLKIWTLSSPLGYIFNFDIYGGKKDKKERCKNGLSLGHNVANRLLLPLNSKGHHIYLDRFFSSIPLMVDLLKGGNRACGAIRSDRKYMPKELRTLKLKEPGDSKHLQCVQCPDLLCCVWSENEQHCVLSTNSKMELITVKFKRGHKSIHVHCPSIISKYNAYMGSLNRVRNRDYCTLLSLSSKWWRYLFLFMFDTCLNNAYIVYNLTNTPQNRNSKSFMDFKLDIVEEVAGSILGNSSTSQGLNLGSSTSNPNLPIPLAIQSTSATVPVLLIHQKVKINGRKQTCKRCSKLKLKTVANYYVQSSYMCNICQICLCTSCFGIYHSENNMVYT